MPVDDPSQRAAAHLYLCARIAQKDRGSGADRRRGRLFLLYAVFIGKAILSFRRRIVTGCDDQHVSCLLLLDAQCRHPHRKR